MLFDDGELAVPEDRADVHIVSFAVADCARLFLDAPDELIRDLLDHVDALGAHTDVARVEHRKEDRGVRSALEIGVGAYDHRVLSAKLKRAGDKPLGAFRRDALSGADRAGKRDLINVA